MRFVSSKKIIIRMIILFLIPIINLSSAFSQGNNLINNKNIPTILFDNFQNHKDKFIELSVQRLHKSISKDSVLRKAFYENDSALYKKLTIVINPLMKLKPEAINYKYEDDIFDYVVLDTINYECISSFYINDTLCFTICRGHNKCDPNIVYFGEPTPDWCTDNYYFFQHFYKGVDGNCLKYEYKAFKDSGFVFCIDGLWHSIFLFKENKLSVYPSSEKALRTGMLDRPNDFVRKTYKEEFIQRCAMRCPLSKTKK